jgi:hypothetical protein
LGGQQAASLESGFSTGPAAHADAHGAIDRGVRFERALLQTSRRSWCATAPA